MTQRVGNINKTLNVGFGRVRHEDANVRRIVLRQEKLIAAVPYEHPLSKSNKPINLKG